MRVRQARRTRPQTPRLRECWPRSGGKQRKNRRKRRRSQDETAGTLGPAGASARGRVVSLPDAPRVKKFRLNAGRPHAPIRARFFPHGQTCRTQGPEKAKRGGLSQSQRVQDKAESLAPVRCRVRVRGRPPGGKTPVGKPAEGPQARICDSAVALAPLIGWRRHLRKRH